MRSADRCPGELFHATFRVLDGLEPLLGFRVAAAQGRLEGVEIGVELGDSCEEVSLQLPEIHEAADAPVPSFGAWPAGLSVMELADSLSAMARGEGWVETGLCSCEMR